MLPMKLPLIVFFPVKILKIRSKFRHNLKGEFDFVTYLRSNQMHRTAMAQEQLRRWISYLRLSEVEGKFVIGEKLVWCRVYNQGCSTISPFRRDSSSLRNNRRLNRLTPRVSSYRKSLSPSHGGPSPSRLKPLDVRLLPALKFLLW